MSFNKRTHKLQDLNLAMVGQTVVLNGWVHRLRDYGSFGFINLRDRGGLVQCVLADNADNLLKDTFKTLKNEYCVAITGLVRERPADMVNPEMASGNLEVLMTQIEILTTSETPPFMIEEGESKANEELRLKYRYLDLRSGAMQYRLQLRHKVAFAIRQFLNNQGFYEIETPILIKSTPEGARDYVVPSRIYPGNFFALPQSPQLYKQILMASGMEKYFQIARCFRDEDPRGDRQPEFTQIDVEMSFVERDDVLTLGEEMMKHLFKETMQINLATPFKRIAYYDALNRFGSDKPDLRFEMELFDVASLIQESSFEVLKNILGQTGTTSKAIIVKQATHHFSRKKITELETLVKQHGLNGLAWLKLTETDELEGGASKFFSGQLTQLKQLGLQQGDVMLIGVGAWKKACTAMGAVRVQIAKELNYLKDNLAFAFAWVVDFPLFEYNEEEQKWEAAHHMFTMPQQQFIATLESNPGEVLGDLYDLVLNGYELASGSIRIHDPELQKRVFRMVGYPDALAQERFGFLLDAFQYGTPPHGGFAPGLDRLVMLMSNTETIREVIAFPKNTQGISPLEPSPSPIDNKQWEELHLNLKKQ